MAQTQQQQESLPATVSATAAAVTLVFVAGEQEVLTGSAQLIRAAIDDQSQVPGLQGRLWGLAQGVSRSILRRVRTLATGAVQVASRNGDVTAVREIQALQRAAEDFIASPVSRIPSHHTQSSAAIANDLTDSLASAAHRITRFADDAYRAATVNGTLVGINPARDIIKDATARATLAEAQAQAWRELTSRGITGFTDSTGRQWNLSSYVEMAVRTATQRAYNASHKARMEAAGITLFTPSTTGRPCKRCAPWEGKVLSDQGEADVVQDGHRFRISATVEEAMAAGLFHPNCEHTLTAFFPGVTVLRTTQWTDRDEQALKDVQRQRTLERAIRGAKQAQAAALTDLDRARAARRVRELQTRMRDHLARTGLNRRSRREQLDLGNK